VAKARTRSGETGVVEKSESNLLKTFGGILSLGGQVQYNESKEGKLLKKNESILGRESVSEKKGGTFPFERLPGKGLTKNVIPMEGVPKERVSVWGVD